MSVQFNLLDDMGDKVGTAEDSIASLSPGDIWKFKAVVLTDEAKNAALDSIHGIVEASDDDTVSKGNLKQIAIGMLQYAQDFDERFPPMADTTILKSSIRPYLATQTVVNGLPIWKPFSNSKVDSLFIDPETEQQYIPNSWLSHRSLLSLSNPAGVAAVYGPSLDNRGLRAVAFADGHVDFIDQNGWTEVKRNSHLP